MVNKILPIAVVLSVISIFGYTQKTKIEHPSKKRFITETFAMDTVLQLPEVKEADKYIRRTTKKKRHLFSMIYGNPDERHPYYLVAVAEDNGMSFVTHFGFFVYINGGKILYYDTLSDSAIDLASWRRKLHRK